MDSSKNYEDFNLSLGAFGDLLDDFEDFSQREVPNVFFFFFKALVRQHAQNPLEIPQAPQTPSFDKNVDLNLSKKLQIKKFALTYPRCERDPVAVLKAITSNQKVVRAGINFCVVAQEKHEDGGLHIHVCLLTNTPLRYTDKNGIFWDFAGGVHGNYQRIRIVADWLRYIIKDGLYVCHPDSFHPMSFISAAKKHQDYNRVLVSQEIMEGSRNIFDINKQHPSFVLMNHAKVVSYINLCNSSDATSLPLLRFPSVVDPSLLSPKQFHIYKWMCSIQTGEYNNDNAHDWKHLRIEGGTGIGKTALVTICRKFLRLFTIPYVLKWWDGYNDEDFDILIGDEYRSQLKLQTLNSLCDGAGTALPMRGMASFLHVIKKPVLLISNYTWDNSYTKVANENPVVLDAVKRRFDTVNFEDGENLFLLLTLIQQHILSLAQGDMNVN